jgi:DNA invertase Pin-like site-specific DNA recombinase
MYIAGLYLRLSKDDERTGESVSIENQRILLTKYAKEKGWEVRDTYIDDGWSGTNFQRPAFRRMMQDAEDKSINVIVVKDLSRLGRNYIEVGRLTEETLPRLGCRFVALNDSVDSMQGENDMMVYRNLFNEFYSKDTSKKVRAVKQACMRQGKYLGSYAPIGYKKDPENKHHLIIDGETAPIVRRIFSMRRGGASIRSIALTLNEERIPPPNVINYSKQGRTPKRGNGLWGESTVKVILKNEAYIGHMVQGKYGTVSYKNHAMVKKPKDNWVRVENTHEPLVSMDDWCVVRELEEKAYKPRVLSGRPQNPFVGVLKCADCGFNMRANTRKDPRRGDSTHFVVDFICGNYARSGKTACTVHTINETALTQLLLEEIRTHAKRAAYDEQRVIDAIRNRKNNEAAAYLSAYKRELKSCEDRLAKLGGMMAVLHEDKVDGVITESMFISLMQNYQQEQEDKTKAVEILRHKVEACEKGNGDIDAWVTLIKEYAGLETLNKKILLELIERIDVFEAEKIDGKRICKIHITYRFVGSIDGVFTAEGVYEQVV